MKKLLEYIYIYTISTNHREDELLSSFFSYISKGGYKYLVTSNEVAL